MTDGIRILGIDPGSQVTGYGIVEYMVLPGYHRYTEALPPRRDA